MNFTSFMFNNIFCEIKGKKVIHWGVENGRTVLISSWKSNFSIYLDIQVYYLDIEAITTLLCLLLVLYVLAPSSYSFNVYVTTALLKSDVFWHSKGYGSPNFRPTRMGLGSFEEEWSEYCILYFIDLFSGKFFFYKFIKLHVFWKKFTDVQKMI